VQVRQFDSSKSAIAKSSGVKPYCDAPVKDRRGSLAALQDPLEFVLHLAQTASQVGVFRLQRGDAIQKLLPIIHAWRILMKGWRSGQEEGLNK
jgi:hypothetical protein